jgi:hypothetical protein
MNRPIRHRDRHPHGQVLVIVAAAMVVLLGIGALVVDLGLSWMLRRDEQNAADPGAIAAARYIPPDNPLSVSGAVQAQMNTAACFYAQESGFFTTDDASCSSARSASPPQLEVNYPPSEQAGDYAGHPGRVEVIIRTQHEGFFGRIFGRSEATVVAGAVAANMQGEANSASLVALDPDTCKAGGISGNGTSVIIEPLVPGTIGGYVHVNSDCSSGAPNTSCESPGDGALRLDGVGSNLTAPYVYVHGTCKTGSSTLNAPLEEGANRIGDPLANLPTPPIELFSNGRCGDGADETEPTGARSKGCGGSGINWEGTECEPGITCVEVHPGVYWGGWTIGNNLKIQMTPGVYYIAGGGVTIQAPSGSIESVGGIGGTPPAVMIFSSDNPNYSCPSGPSHGCQGGIDLLANSTFKLTGLTEAACAPLGYPVCPYQGLLLWQDGDGSKPDSVVKLGGQTNLEISGTIYAPNAEVQMNGGSDGTGVASVQIIAWRWDIGGGAQLYMPYDPGGLWHPKARGLVH